MMDRMIQIFGFLFEYRFVILVPVLVALAIFALAKQREEDRENAMILELLAAEVFLRYQEI